MTGKGLNMLKGYVSIQPKSAATGLPLIWKSGSIGLWLRATPGTARVGQINNWKRSSTALKLSHIAASVAKDCMKSLAPTVADVSPKATA